MKSCTDHIVFAGGGTAGHLFPGLAVAEALSRRMPEVKITFAGTGKPFELAQVRAAGFEQLALPCRPFPRRASEALGFLTDHFAGYYAARHLLRSQEVTLVIGLGGYASVPAARAASRLNIPVVLLEQNAVPGRATRWLAPAASLVCAAFEGIRPFLKSGCRVRVTGNPLRREFVEPSLRPRAVSEGLGKKRKLVVLGGSGGAQTLNEQSPLAIYKAREALANWQIVHQSGPRDLERVGELYRKLGIEATVVSFIDNMPRVLRGSHLAISRAGGTTLAELAASGVPAVLLPYPRATDDHQTRNAEVFAGAGAARILDERRASERLDNQLADTIVELTSGHAERLSMAQAISRLARPQATARVVRLVGNLLAHRPLEAL